MAGQGCVGEHGVPGEYRGGGGDGGKGWRGGIIMGEGWLNIICDGWLNIIGEGWLIGGCGENGTRQGIEGRWIEAAVRIEVPIGPCHLGKQGNLEVSGGLATCGRVGERERSECAIRTVKVVTELRLL